MANSIKQPADFKAPFAKYNREGVRRKVAESVGGETIGYQLEEDGEVFQFPHPFFYDDDTLEALQNLGSKDREGQGRVLLGEEAWERFKAAGGTTQDVNLLMIQVNDDLEDRKPNGDPTPR